MDAASVGVDIAPGGAVILAGANTQQRSNRNQGGVGVKLHRDWIPARRDHAGDAPGGKIVDQNGVDPPAGDVKAPGARIDGKGGRGDAYGRAGKGLEHDGAFDHAGGGVDDRDAVVIGVGDIER